MLVTMRRPLGSLVLALAIPLGSAAGALGCGGEASSDAGAASGDAGVGLHMPCNDAIDDCAAGTECCYPARPEPGVVPICQAPGETCDPP